MHLHTHNNLKQRPYSVISFFLVSVIFFCVCGSTAFAAESIDTLPDISEYIQIVYDDTEGLPSNEANDILYSSNGYIWIGSYGGLTRYDSNKFISYGVMNDTIMHGVNIRTLFEDSMGRIWIGSNDRGVYVWENGCFSKIDTSSCNISNSIRDFSETSDGKILIASSHGLAVATANNQIGELSFDVRDISIPQLSEDPIYALLCDSQGNNWAITNKDVFSFSISNTLGDNIEYRLSHSWTHAANYECNCITETNDGTIMIGTVGTNIIQLVPTENGIGYRIVLKSTGNCYTINRIYQDSNGRIWLCSDSGIGYLTDNGIVYAGHTTISSSIENMTEDYEGNLWFASSRGGVMKLVRGKFSSTNHLSGLNDTVVNATIIYNDQLYAATDTGLKILDAQTFKNVKNELSALLDGIRIRGLMADSSGYLWITTYKDFGIIRYKDGEYISINSEAGLPSDQTRVSCELSNGNIAVATNGGLSIISGTSVIKNYTEANGLSNPEILCVCEDKSGNIYCGSDGNGIYVISGESVTHYTPHNGLPADVVLNLVYDETTDSVWISAAGCISVLKDGQITVLPHYQNGTDSIFDIKFVNDSDVWLISKTSIAITSRDYLLNGEGDIIILGKNDGLSEITANSRHYLSDSGNLYIASNGISTIDTDNVYSNPTPPKAIINSITIDNKEVINNPTETVMLDSGVNSITIDFTALNYVTGECTLEYQLVGMDAEPLYGNGSEIHSRDYTNLRGGKYIFRISVISPSGVESDEDITLVIEKKLSFIEHPLGIAFIALCALCLIGIGVAVCTRIRTARLNERQERYHALTETALLTVAKTIDAKDSYTNGHSYRVAQYSRDIAERLGWKGDQLENLYYTALLHDIGKIGIPDHILTKKGKLTAEEYQIVQKHPVVGYKILKDFTTIPDVDIGARYHHERYDGSGYAMGLSGEDIPINARIIAVADAYDAMSTARVYREALTKEQIIHELKECAGKQFDPQIAQILLDMIAEGSIYSEE